MSLTDPVDSGAPRAWLEPGAEAIEWRSGVGGVVSIESCLSQGRLGIGSPVDDR